MTPRHVPTVCSPSQLRRGQLVALPFVVPSSISLIWLGMWLYSGVTVANGRGRGSPLCPALPPSSERVHKTNSSGQTLREAKHINTSLHFLEMVIINLTGKKKKRGFVPYRNCRITQVLRDSLGGNCKTAMIATINPEAAQTEESISTCRFAQRVAQVKNSAIVNEETDPYLLIKRLKAEVASLKAEIAFLNGEQVDRCRCVYRLGLTLTRTLM